MREKEVKTDRCPCTDDFYLTVYNELKAGKRPSQIASQYNISKQKLQYYINALKRVNLIKKIGYGVWECAEKSEEEVKKEVKISVCNTKGTPYKEIRGHGFVLTVKIPKFENWENREKFLIKEQIQYLTSTIAQGKGQRIIINNFKIWLFNKRIVIYAPKGKSYFCNSALEAKGQVMTECLELVCKLERLFKVSLRINKVYHIKVVKQHYADIKNALAKQYNEAGKKGFVVVDDSGAWLLIDNSFNLDELETVHSKTADVDMDDVVKPFFNSMKLFYEENKKAPTVTEIYKLIDFSIKNQVVYAENIQLHLSTLKDMKETLKEIRDEITKKGLKMR